MIKSISRFLPVGALLCLLSSAQAQINGYHSNPRVFNDFSTSTLTINTGVGNPANISIDDRNLTDDGIGGNFANRHDVLASSDGGASNFTFNTTQGIKISTTLTLSDGSNAPRKEAGIRINGGSGTSDVLFIVNSDAGEIVTFGGPFHLFGNNAGGNGYVPGTPITLTLQYNPPGLVGPAGQGVISYTVNYPTRGINETFTSAYGNLEGGPGNGSSFGVYTQISPANAADFVTANFGTTSASLVPEPASIGALSLGTLAFVKRRRGR